MKSSVDDCKLLSLSRIENEFGSIAIVEGGKLVPFNVKRIYYLYDIPAGKSRGGHGHKELFQLLVAASGSFNVELFDGVEKRVFFLNRPDVGLLLMPGIWRELTNFASGSICLVLASEVYIESDYLYDINSFLEFKRK
jgi:hypothetical protein